MQGLIDNEHYIICAGCSIKGEFSKSQTISKVGFHLVAQLVLIKCLYHINLSNFQGFFLEGRYTTFFARLYNICTIVEVKSSTFIIELRF